jgi:Flp pilus assembly protein TadG
MSAPKADRGSVSVELVLLTPLLVVLALFVVLSGRSGESLRQVQHAADEGARVASQASLSHRETAGAVAARTDLIESGVACKRERISVARVNLGRLDGVRVDVSCEIDHAGLSILKLHGQRISAQSIEVIDYYRAD